LLKLTLFLLKGGRKKMKLQVGYYEETALLVSPSEGLPQRPTRGRKKMKPHAGLWIPRPLWSTINKPHKSLYIEKSALRNIGSIAIFIDVILSTPGSRINLLA